MPDLGVRLQLFVGPTVPVPAPYAVVDALTRLEVRNNDRERDGFQMSFTLGRATGQDYSLLSSGLLDPPNRVVIMVIIGVIPQILIDGIITQHQVTPSNRPGESTLTVNGDDISLKLDLEDKNQVHRNQSDSTIVQNILNSYITYGIVPNITQTQDTPNENDRVTTQQATDLAFIQQLARRNGFVFYIEPTSAPGFSTAYWGKDNRQGQAQPPLTMNMGTFTNVDTPINFTYNALGPATPQLDILEPLTKQTLPVPLPSGLLPSLASLPASSLRTTLPRNTANLSLIQALLAATSSATQSSDAVTGSGEVDAVRYGRALRSRRLVGVRGVGQSYDGNYYVQQVTHRIQRGEYKQSFTLTREGRGASSPVVTL